MINVDRELFKQLAAGRFATLNQTYNKQDAEGFQSGALWAYDLIMRSLVKPTTDKLPTNDELNEIN